jgi:hypothetical protein
MDMRPPVDLLARRSSGGSISAAATELWTAPIASRQQAMFREPAHPNRLNRDHIGAISRCQTAELIINAQGNMQARLQQSRALWRAAR